ncbi:hypothetical protein ACHHYP_00247 [Achlya hypogyna]|uniref:Transmembrane protein n=1 Tax=Achlya hypogyna TaxID=1202772 RepID=A0A1V9ZB03_ACHHY|nr:hypothetical protein ACHHYP_00247 [Achlya hypogyna]
MADTAEATKDVKVEIKPEPEPAAKADGKGGETKAAKGDQKVAPAKDYRGNDDRPDYKVVCCGNSWGDLIFIPVQTILLYGFLICYSILIVYATYQSTITQAALWVYFFAWGAGVVYLGVTIATADWETRLKKELAAKMALEEAKEAA